jgi:hypothetical protein
MTVRTGHYSEKRTLHHSIKYDDPLRVSPLYI